MAAPVHTGGAEHTVPNIESPNRYRHQALDTSTRQIRLIKLRPGQSDQPHCDISVFDLDSAPPFVALSYTWGPPSPQFDILINGESLSIRENLFQFLQVFMVTTERDWMWKPYRSNYLWIDQICIDQSSILERNHQVGMMASIYSGCYETIIWLGNIHNNPDAPCIIKKMGHSSVPMEDLLQAGASIAENDYFSRLWIVQEVILSKRKRVLCGHPSVGAVWVDWVILSFIVSHSKCRTRSTAAGYLARRLSDDLVSLPHAILRFSQSHCQDPHDKVYGLMGLVKAEERLEIDYAKPLKDIFLRLMIAFSKESVFELVSSPTDYQDALVNLGRNWKIISESLNALLHDMWIKPRHTSFSYSPVLEDWDPSIDADDPSFDTLARVSDMGFCPSSLHENVVLEWELLPYSSSARGDSWHPEQDAWLPTEECWWYRIGDTIYEIYGLENSGSLHGENTKPAYYGKRVRKRHKDWRSRLHVLSSADT